MHVLTTESVSNQTLTIVPRIYYSSGTLYYKLTNKESKTETTGSVTATVTTHYIQNLTGVFSLTEGAVYFFELWNDETTQDNTTLVYRGTILCTDQTPGEYTHNNDTYVSRADNTTYITR